MRIVNMAHGSYFMLGGYVGLTVVLRTRSFALAVLAGTVAIALVGMGMERLFLRRLRGEELGQVLMTIGFALIFQDLALLIWGGDPYNLPVPAALSGSLRAGGAVFPVYRIFIVAVAVVVGIALWLLLDRTRAGAMIRAAVDDAEMAQGVGINVPRASLAVFSLGAALAALGGVIGAGFLGVYPGADFEVLPYAFVVVIVGGLGSLPGAMVPRSSRFRSFAGQNVAARMASMGSTPRRTNVSSSRQVESKWKFIGMPESVPVMSVTPVERSWANLLASVGTRRRTS